MLDDARKVASWCRVREVLLSEEVDRLEQYVKLVIDTTPYCEKTVQYQPRIASIRTPGLLGDFVNLCKSRNIDVVLAGTSCIIRIHAPCPKRRDTTSGPSPTPPARKKA
jgi:hypothetical protein